MTTAPCFFASFASASVLGPGIFSASVKKRWSSLWQKYWLANSSCVHRIFAPSFAARSSSAHLAREVRLRVRPAGHLRDRHAHRARGAARGVHAGTWRHFGSDSVRTYATRFFICAGVIVRFHAGICTAFLKWPPPSEIVA